MIISILMFHVKQLLRQNDGAGDEVELFQVESII